LRVMQSLGYRSAMIVALVARGQTLGALTFATAESERHYGPADVALAEQLASRAALALDNARLFRDAQQALAARYRSLVEEQAARGEAEQARAEAERAQRDAESANTAKDDFLAILSHELRSPLGVILTWSHLLRRGALDAARVDHAIDRIERSALAQKQMIEDLLDVSRVIAGKLRLDVQPTDLTDVVEAAVGAFRAAAPGKGGGPPSGRPPLAPGPGAAGGPGGGGAGGPRPPAADRLEPAQQRAQVHAGLRAGRGAGRAARERGPGHRARHRTGDRRGLPAPSLRALPSGRQQQHPDTRRPRARPGDRPPPGGAARRSGRGDERRSGAGRRVHRDPAAPRPAR